MATTAATRPSAYTEHKAVCMYDPHGQCRDDPNMCVREDCPMMSTVDHRPPNIATKQLQVLGAALAVCLVAIFVTAIYAVTQVKANERAAAAAVAAAAKWDPLGDYPTQKVLDRVDGVTGPAVMYSAGAVTIQGSKENASKEPVDIIGRVTWEPVEPPQGAIALPPGDSTRDPGVTTRTFINAFPPEVRHRIELHAKQGITQTLWRITGVETPTRGAQQGVPRKYQSDNFTIIYDGPAPAI